MADLVEATLRSVPNCFSADEWDSASAALNSPHPLPFPVRYTSIDRCLALQLATAFVAQLARIARYRPGCSIRWRATKGTGKHAMALAISEVRMIVDRVCARQDVLDACAKRDLGTVIAVLNGHGLTQGQIADLTGILQGRLSEYARHKRVPKASTTFEAFANGLDMPPAARQALGLAATPSGSRAISLADFQQGPDLEGGLQYPDSPGLAAGNVSALWRADLTDQGVLERGMIHPAAWSDASLRWLVDPGSSTGASNDSLGGVRIGLGDVERFRTTVELFRQLDDRFGGGHARQSLIQYLSSDSERLLRGRYPEAVGKAMFAAVPRPLCSPGG
jgi:transcriptional regulator with XRE-family HTH domain